METPTPFDLNQAVHCWRAALAEHSTTDDENLNELESHLRDSVATLQTRGLSAEEAFLIASRRLGRPEEIGPEFGKVNTGIIWRSRALWMLTGMLLLIVGRDLSLMAAAAVTWLGSVTATNGIVLGWLGAATRVLTLGLIALLFWLLTTGKLSRWVKIPMLLRHRPVGTAIILLGGMLSLKLATGILTSLYILNFGPQALGQTYVVTMWFNSVSPVLALVVLVTLFSRLLSSRIKTAAWIIVPLLSLSLQLAPAQAQTNSQPPSPAGAGTLAKKDIATLGQAMKQYSAGQRDAAVATFLAVDFARRPLFDSGSVLNYTEAQFAALPQAARDKLGQQMLADIKTVKVLCATVKRAGEDALESGDKAKAEKCFAQLTKCGEAFTHPDSLALLKLVGRAVKDLVPEPTQPKAPAPK
jgi:hypothetical protein